MSKVTVINPESLPILGEIDKSFTIKTVNYTIVTNGYVLQVEGIVTVPGGAQGKSKVLVFETKEGLMKGLDEINSSLS